MSEFLRGWLAGAALAFGLVLTAPALAVDAPRPPAPAASGPVKLPPGIVWETNDDDPPIGSAEAIRGADVLARTLG